MQARAKQTQKNKAHEAAGKLFKSHSYSAIILDTHKEIFNKMSLFVVIIIAKPWVSSIGFRWNTKIGIMIGNIFPIIPGTVCFVSENGTSWNIELVKAFPEHRSVIDLSAGQFQYQRITQSIYDCVDFGGSSSTTNANALFTIAIFIPFFAPVLARCALI